MNNPLEQSDLALPVKLGQVFGRLAVAMRAANWESFGEEGLNPTQGQILLLLLRRNGNLRLAEIAAELSVSSPTVSDSVAALVHKSLVIKKRAADDGRAVAVSLTKKGRKLVERLDGLGGEIESAASALTRQEQVTLYRLMIQMVRELQQQARIPLARMCVTCQYFRPNYHDDPIRPHHCALVDAAFGDQTIRADCPDHEAAEEHLAEHNWIQFSSV